MKKLVCFSIGVIAGCAAVSASATNYTATPANFAAVFMAAQSGDSITVSGNFGAVNLADKSFLVPLRIDATAASFDNSLVIKNVTGVNFVGGTYGSTSGSVRYNAAVAAFGDTNIGFSHATVVGAQTGTGIAFIGSTGLTVTASTFDGLHSGVDFGSSSYGTLSGNRSINSESDGFDIANSHFVTVTNTTCSGTVPGAGAHPDCVQLSSLAGNPVQSDITITGNTAKGATQGFTSFNPADGGGLRIDISDNVIATSFSQGIACYACVDSSIVRNTLTTLPGAKYRTNLNVIGGSDNLVFDNTLDGKQAPDDPAPLATADLSPNLLNELSWTPSTFADLLTSALPGDSAGPPPVAGAPEPTEWAFMVIGFGAIGATLRRRNRYAVA